MYIFILCLSLYSIILKILNDGLGFHNVLMKLKDAKKSSEMPGQASDSATLA